MRSNKPVLLAEDDEVDVMSVQKAFKSLHITNELIVVGNGEEALNYLKDNKNVKPCVILLDIKMPLMDGIEFLKIIKTDEELRRIPVVVLTTSTNENDRMETFKLSIAGYMAKPVDHLRFIETIKTIDMYWTLSQFPEE